MLRSILPVLILSICGPTWASSPIVYAKPTLEDYTERRIQDCTRFSDLGVDGCEAMLAKQYKRAPFMNSAGFISALAKNKNLTRSLTVVSEAQLASLTAELLALPINFHEEINGCSERAEAIAYVLMKKHKVNVGQVYLKGRIRVTSIHIPLDDAMIRWGYHIAPFIMVRNAAGKIYPYSLDLTLLNGVPRPVDQWIDLVQKDSSELLEVHAMRGFESNPVEPGDTPLRSWGDRPTDLIEAGLSEARPVSIHRGSPMRTDLAADFMKLMVENQVTMRNPFDPMSNMEEPKALGEWLSGSAMKALKKKILSELRCEEMSAGVLHCGVYFADDDGFCEAQTEIPRTAKEPFSILCYPFNK